MGHKFAINSKLTLFSRELRKNQTDAERIIWSHLRRRQLAGVKFYRQFAIDHYILDFYCPKKFLAVELDGSQHISAKSYDDKRTADLNKKGLTVLRFWDNEALTNTDGVIQVIYNFIVKPQNSP